MSETTSSTSTTKTMEDYLGCAGLDWSGTFDFESGLRSAPTWEPRDDADPDEFGSKVVQRFRDFKSTLETNGLLPIWRRNYRQYFNGPAKDGKANGWGWSEDFGITGENGEVVGVRVSEARNLITHMANLACSMPGALRSIAEDATPESLEAAQIADSTLKRDFNPTQGGQLIREGVEIALVITAGFMDAEWDVFAGESYMPKIDGLGTYYTGKPKLSMRMPDEVAFDISKKTWDDVDQVIVLQRANRYKLAAQFPDLADEILSAPSITDSEFKPFRYADEHSDDIILLRYMHKAGNKRFLPQGRLSLVLENGTVIRDGSSPYALIDTERLGIFPITAGSGLGTVYGYATMNDLSPLKQWLDLMTTMAATLVAGFGAPNLTGPIMNSIQPQALVGGGRYFGVPANSTSEVKPLHLLDEGSLKAILEVAQLVMQLGEKHSGMNGVIRGEGGDHSGKYVALVKSMAVQFMTGLQQNIVAVMEKLGNYLIRLREKLSTTEDVVEITGEHNRPQVVRYKAAERFKRIARVAAEAVDPLSQTPEGREMVVDKILDKMPGAFVTPQHYLTAVKTGNFDPMFRAPMATLNLITRENQMLMKGETPIVLDDDVHDVHISEHLANLAEPTVRENKAIVEANLEHVARHKLSRAGVPFLQGKDQVGQPYPPATLQWAQAKVQLDAQAAANAAAQQSATPGPGQGQASGTNAPAGQAPASPQGAGAPVPAAQAMQQAAMGP